MRFERAALGAAAHAPRRPPHPTPPPCSASDDDDGDRSRGGAPEAEEVPEGGALSRGGRARPAGSPGGGEGADAGADADGKRKPRVQQRKRPKLDVATLRVRAPGAAVGARAPGGGQGAPRARAAGGACRRRARRAAACAPRRAHLPAQQPEGLMDVFQNFPRFFADGFGGRGNEVRRAPRAAAAAPALARCAAPARRHTPCPTRRPPAPRCATCGA